MKKGDRDKMYSAMLESGVSSKSAENSEMMTLQWQHGVVSNYEYLLHLNSLGKLGNIQNTSRQTTLHYTV